MRVASWYRHSLRFNEKEWESAAIACIFNSRRREVVWPGCIASEIGMPDGIMPSDKNGTCKRKAFLNRTIFYKRSGF